MANIKNITTGVSFAIRYNKLIIYYNLGKLNKKYKKVQVEVNLKAIFEYSFIYGFFSSTSTRVNKKKSNDKKEN